LTVHPQIAKALDALAKANLPPIHTLSPDAARELMGAMSRARGGEPTPVRQTKDRRIPGPAGGIPVRIYQPYERATGALVYYHGGGHVIGDLDTHDKICRNLCVGADAVVVSVDYRMGPEHRFPAAVEDAWAALQWTAGAAAELGAPAGRLAVAGDSAGGNLAAVAALMARDAGGPALGLQVLIYPVVDYGLAGDCYRRYGEGYGVLTDKAMAWFRDHYLAEPGQAADWRASPVLAASFAGVAPALVLAAECDVLHDDGVRIAAALKEGGVPTDFKLYPGMIHGFFGMAPDVDDAIAAQRQVSDALRAAFAA